MDVGADDDAFFVLSGYQAAHLLQVKNNQSVGSSLLSRRKSTFRDHSSAGPQLKRVGNAERA